MKKYWIIRFVFIVSATLSANVMSTSSHPAMGAVGEPGNSKHITRTIKITVIDNQFLPLEIEVTQGETIQFIVKNGGSKKHEMIIDSMTNLKKQAKIRRSNPDTIATELNQIQLEPGERKVLIWKFTERGIVDFACPLPGHFKKMRGK